MKKGYELLLKTWYKKVYEMRYTIKSFMSIVLTFGILLVLFVYVSNVSTLTAKESHYFVIWIIVSSTLIVANIMGALLFKHVKLKKYAVIIPYISGLTILFCPSFILSWIADKMDYYFIQCMVIAVVTMFSFIYQTLIVEYVETFNNYTKKQYMIHGPAAIVLLPGTVIILISAGFDSSTLMIFGVLLLMSAMGTFVFPQFARIIPYWQGPKEVKSRYDNVLNKLK